MIHVAQIVTRFIAGAGGVALRGAQALDPHCYRVSILAADGGPLLAEAERSGFEVVRLRHLRPEVNPREDLRCLHELTHELATLRPDVVHTHSAKAGALGRMAARRAGVRATVHTFHGFPFHDFQMPIMRRTYIEIERRLGRHTDRFLAVGANVAADAVRLGIASPERLRVIAPAIDTSSIVAANPSSRAEARRRLGVRPDAPVVGTVGRLAGQKAPEHMLDAFQRLGRTDARFVWIGGGPLERRMRELASRRGLQNRFLFLGERRDVGYLLPGLDVFAMSSLYEGLPCSIAEAMTAGVPVVATAVNAVPELVVPGRTGILVPAGAPALLARAIGHLLDHPEERTRLAAGARTQVQDRFDPAQLGSDLAETYSQLLEEHRDAPALRLNEVTTA
ncbi:MAG: glycosyltransferase [Candidatus Dormibacteraeota bacterium]|nr:glycosyltransferase [Candidatus Dormibacteraeota bacterium]